VLGENPSNHVFVDLDVERQELFSRTPRPICRQLKKCHQF